MSANAVTIIVTVYNSERYLRQCIQSAINQTLRTVEILLIDDGSTDNSPAICDMFSEMDDRVRVIHRRNDGLSSARNLGISEAAGEYIMFLDDDDWLEKDACSEAVAIAQRYEADVVFWPYVRERGDRAQPKNLLDEPLRVFQSAEELGQLHLRMVGPLNDQLRRIEDLDSFATAWGKLYAKSVVQGPETSFVDTKSIGTAEDVLFNVHVFGLLNRAVYINKFLYHYRRDNGASLTSRYKPDLPEQWKHLFRLIEAHITEKELGPEFRKALHNRIALSIVGLGLNELLAPMPRRSGIRRIKRILRDETLGRAYRSVDTRQFAPHWRAFYYLVKSGNATAVYLALRLITAVRESELHSPIGRKEAG